MEKLIPMSNIFLEFSIVNSQVSINKDPPLHLILSQMNPDTTLTPLL
jgi:hypothetical protein